jgi:multidrug efflux pump subunit AcrB
VQTPEYRVASKNDLDNIAASTSGGAVMPNVLGNVAAAKRLYVQSVFNHSNIQPVYDVDASVQDRDLGSTAAAIHGPAATPSVSPCRRRASSGSGVRIGRSLRETRARPRE